MSRRNGDSGLLTGLAAAAGVAIGIAGVGLAAYLYDKDQREAEERRARSPTAVASPTAGGRPVSAAEFVARFETPSRDASEQPQRVIDELVRPAMEALKEAGSGSLVVAEIGCEAGYFTSRLARALPTASVIACEADAELLAFCASRCAAAGVGNVRFAAPGRKHAGLPERAGMLLLLNSYHRLERRVEWLRSTAMLDLARTTPAFLLIVEFRSGALPVHARAPPEALRLERSTILAEAAEAGFALVAAPDWLEHHVALLFMRDAAEGGALGAMGGGAASSATAAGAGGSSAGGGVGEPRGPVSPSSLSLAGDGVAPPAVAAHDPTTI